MNIDLSTVEIKIDDEGYLVDPDDWSEELAEQFARNEHLQLTEDHWKVIGFMRNYYDNKGIAADARFVIKYLAEKGGYGARAKSRLFELFPYGYVKQACRVAGMRRSRAWSTG